MTYGRLIGRLAIAVACGTSLVSSQAAEGKSERLVLSRTTTGPASFELGVALEPGEQGGFAGYVFATVKNGSVVAVSPGGQGSYGQSDDPGVHAMGTSFTTCSAGVCGVYRTLLGTLEVTASDDGGPAASNRVFLVVEGEEVRIRFKASGWTLQPAAFAYRYVEGRDANAAGAGAMNGAELFLDAEAPGGAGGSIAQATPPCSQAIVGIPARGAGRLTLDGGTSSPSVICPASTFPTIADFAPNATTWRAEGPVAGDRTLNDTRLLVVDLPH